MSNNTIGKNPENLIAGQKSSQTKRSAVIRRIFPVTGRRHADGTGKDGGKIQCIAESEFFRDFLNGHTAVFQHVFGFFHPLAL